MSDGTEAISCVRFLPTTGPTMVENTFVSLVDSQQMLGRSSLVQLAVLRAYGARS